MNNTDAVLLICVAVMFSSCSIGEGIGKLGSGDAKCIEATLTTQRQVVELQKQIIELRSKP